MSQITMYSHLRILVVQDADVYSSTLLAELYVRNPPRIDLIIVIGPLGQRDCSNDISITQISESGTNISRTNISTAPKDSSISTVLAQLENICCRVVYLPSRSDMPETMNQQLHLTPNSVNIHGRLLQLIPKTLSVTGFTLPDIENDDFDPISSYLTSISSTNPPLNNIILCLNNTTDLDHFLFHSSSDMSNIVMLVTQQPQVEVKVDFIPALLQHTTNQGQILPILFLPSLRGDYQAVEVNLKKRLQKWKLAGIDLIEFEK